MGIFVLFMCTWSLVPPRGRRPTPLLRRLAPGCLATCLATSRRRLGRCQGGDFAPGSNCHLAVDAEEDKDHLVRRGDGVPRITPLGKKV